jgi:hypothetical protein
MVGAARINWVNVLAWIVRSTYTCCPRAYIAATDYLSGRHVEHFFNKQAYNHENGCWAALKKTLGEMANSASHVDDLTQCFIVQPCQKAIQAAIGLQTFLSGITGFGPFNTKEILWNVTLVREAMDRKRGRHYSQMVAFRQAAFKTSQYGTGGLAGLQVFFPRATVVSSGTDAADLRRHLQVAHDISFQEAHELQWTLCIFSKSLNPAYRRLPRSDSLKPASFFAAWEDRFSSYVGKHMLFETHAEGMGLEDEFRDFAASCRKLSRLIASGDIAKDCACRRCWHEHDAMVLSDSNKSHAWYVRQGASCMRGEHACTQAAKKLRRG